MFNDRSGSRGPRWRRQWVLIALVLGLGSLVWAGCGSSSSDGESSSADSAKTNPGVPKVNVRFGMQPFGDHTMFVTGMTKGWFDEVGINIEPQPLGRDVPPGQAAQELVTNQLDMVSEYTPLAVQEMAHLPDIKIAGWNDINFGTFVFADPELGLESLEERIEGGESLEEAMEKIGEEMKGNSYAIEASGFHRIFYNTVAKYGKISLNDDLDLSVLEDPQIVQQALGGQLDFASPAGVAQMVQLFQAGWTPLVDLETLVEELPPEQVAPMLGNTGWQATEKYLEENHDTVLRFNSVVFRIIDAVLKDPEATLPDQTTYLERVTGTDIGVPGLTKVLTEIDPLTPFDEQADYWVNEDARFYYTKLYEPQIEAAQEGGVLPKNKQFKASDLIVAGKYYEELVELKEKYDGMVGQAGDLSGEKKELAEDAATQYEAFNYLDAVRLLEEALA